MINGWAQEINPHNGSLLVPQATQYNQVRTRIYSIVVSFEELLQSETICLVSTLPFLP